MNAKTQTAACVCGKRHRAGTVCATAERITRERAHADAVLAILRTVPANTVVMYDERTGAERVRSLGDVETIVARHASVAEASSEKVVATDGSLLHYYATHGGGVANSYKYRAESDELRVVEVDGRVLIHAWRGNARKGPHGNVANPNYLLSPSAAREVTRYGVHYSAAIVAAAVNTRRLEANLARRLKSLPLDAHELVELDEALECGAV